MLLRFISLMRVVAPWQPVQFAWKIGWISASKVAAFWPGGGGVCATRGTMALINSAGIQSRISFEQLMRTLRLLSGKWRTANNQILIPGAYNIRSLAMAHRLSIR